MPDQYTVVAGASSAAPTRPPIRACDDDEGIPKYQVIRFHEIAPISAARTTPRPDRPVGGSMMPLPTVSATPAPKNEPSRLPTAATPSATRGVRARVDTEVAIAFAASWKPLV